MLPTSHPQPRVARVLSVDHLSTQSSDTHMTFPHDGKKQRRSGKSKKKSKKAKKVPLRRGKWTPEEETYATRLMEEFKSGVLPLSDGTTLRSFLSSMLNCDPMRISKKFVGDNSIGKQIFRKNREAIAGMTPEQKEKNRCELAALEAAFLERVGESKSPAEDTTTDESSKNTSNDSSDVPRKRRHQVDPSFTSAPFYELAQNNAAALFQAPQNFENSMVAAFAAAQAQNQAASAPVPSNAVAANHGAIAPSPPPSTMNQHPALLAFLASSMQHNNNNNNNSNTTAASGGSNAAVASLPQTDGAESFVHSSAPRQSSTGNRQRSNSSESLNALRSILSKDESQKVAQSSSQGIPNTSSFDALMAMDFQSLQSFRNLFSTNNLAGGGGNQATAAAALLQAGQHNAQFSQQQPQQQQSVNPMAFLQQQQQQQQQQQIHLQQQQQAQLQQQQQLHQQQINNGVVGEPPPGQSATNVLPQHLNQFQIQNILSAALSNANGSTTASSSSSQGQMQSQQQQQQANQALMQQQQQPNQALMHQQQQTNQALMQQQQQTNQALMQQQQQQSNQALMQQPNQAAMQNVLASHPQLAVFLQQLQSNFGPSATAVPMQNSLHANLASFLQQQQHLRDTSAPISHSHPNLAQFLQSMEDSPSPLSSSGTGTTPSSSSGNEGGASSDTSDNAVKQPQSRKKSAEKTGYSAESSNSPVEGSDSTNSPSNHQDDGNAPNQIANGLAKPGTAEGDSKRKALPSRNEGTKQSQGSEGSDCTISDNDVGNKRREGSPNGYAGQSSSSDRGTTTSVQVAAVTASDTTVNQYGSRRHPEVAVAALGESNSGGSSSTTVMAATASDTTNSDYDIAAVKIAHPKHRQDGGTSQSTSIQVPQHGGDHALVSSSMNDYLNLLAAAGGISSEQQASAPFQMQAFQNQQQQQRSTAYHQSASAAALAMAQARAASMARNNTNSRDGKQKSGSSRKRNRNKLSTST